ncbi:helix-turn-helix domain-containing protein [Apibacter adventoris]|uniref:DNA-binding protein n=1 Tax=Apibacter adventoris TaxID=1679466 RepID=A0A2S8A848_9FLAO|nr:helix-turn-helix domain-containing protein [Apibacter adventoris]PQL90741.1 DNA-binding protein [Apibacter adventoris]
MIKDFNKSKNSQKLQMVTQKEILSFKEAVLYLDVSESFLYKLTSKKAICFSKPNNGKIYFKKSDLDRWMLQNQSKSIEILEEELNQKIKQNGKSK